MLLNKFLLLILKIKIMKKLMMIAAFMVACVEANAQIYVGGGIGFNTAGLYDGISLGVRYKF